MADIKAPVFPESVADGTIVEWHVTEGQQVSRDDLLAEIETDKVVLEVVAPDDGVVTKIVKDVDDTVLSDELIAQFEAGASAGEAPAVETDQPAAPVQEKQAADGGEPVQVTDKKDEAEHKDQSPAVRKAAKESGVDPKDVEGSGRGGRVTKTDMANPTLKSDSSIKSDSGRPVAESTGERTEKRVPMTRLRKRVAERLLSASQDTAMLTTFNEVNMKPLMDMRAKYKEKFEKRHGVRLGFMSLFVKAATEALKRFPAVNASLDGDDIVYHGFYDIGVAVSSDRGLVVPVLRDTDRMGMADIEAKIREYGSKAQEGKLGLDEMTGGTFTISNGGVFGSLMSTPILNPPQTAILGMHAINERPMAVDGKVEILPMMYLALSYDHRMIDGKEAVQFLVTIKELVEDPAMLLLDL
ncbi:MULTISPECIES: 2-oxoglutarate dehydrogenase complex dihydrolipoyllysine-residue succinyltransferase [Psychrobacter]|jgi:2-oxoglutarate dehydrogenase E2 component (dihydrolipoamide succinyltransferase)|uniref:Dihydrolipoyllysine-residue succinyltransferase component of 2-oxoglutarate dehydrogenase complex n=2 Tax=Psychrobacter TaxID=497 RepID=A0A1G6XJ46_9GAMM|nr:MULTISPECIES: 2-oxoglutarate dehydrogenase complex dihydrolipoyllysine-residue succinyltransferase [Psychrobacter]MDH4903753.1 dihydrolipoyllysine-residue succinyltransferase [Psychrobacter pocilloporae]GLR28123.1 dihydrolipoyllysine-residue succinyltransferase component of 2-oxoglutarate dehydrogenase complex [Psychrobacter pacificensis]SDD78219.1 2-oxoglutarate dehydrogenase E2 component [Psychrobacter pacificensis]|tara:strand:- start:8374 stop:9609 length:1236 start_codon:yes stop_codon:yes gene_type:complete